MGDSISVVAAANAEAVVKLSTATATVQSVTAQRDDARGALNATRGEVTGLTTTFNALNNRGMSSRETLGMRICKRQMTHLSKLGHNCGR